MEKKPYPLLMRFGFIVCLLLLAFGMLWFFGLLDTVQALGEYFRPTTVMEVAVPSGCVETAEEAPADLMRIVENQKSRYRLTLQRLIVCRSASRYPALERRFAGVPYGDYFRREWKPLPEGCCSVHSGRHVIVVAADSIEQGTVLVEAALIQDRADYLRFRWGERQDSWLKRWCGGLLKMLS
jgi:hypothetical protein